MPVHDFVITNRDSVTSARAGVLTLPHGQVKTPCYMPVGTQASVKALSTEDVLACGSEILLANTYHLMLRPGADLIEKAGGLHSFMHWEKPILTDSGGFQVSAWRTCGPSAKRGSNSNPIWMAAPGR